MFNEKDYLYPVYFQVSGNKGVNVGGINQPSNASALVQGYDPLERNPNSQQLWQIFREVGHLAYPLESYETGAAYLRADLHGWETNPLKEVPDSIETLLYNLRESVKDSNSVTGLVHGIQASRIQAYIDSVRNMYRIKKQYQETKKNLKPLKQPTIDEILNSLIKSKQQK